LRRPAPKVDSRRMKRNRKREPLQTTTVARTLLACACVGVVGLGYVWQKTQIYRLGDELKKREGALVAVEKRNAMLAAQLAHLKSPGQLETQCQLYQLGLVAPRENQVVRVYEPGPEWDGRFIKPVAAQVPAKPTRQKVVARR
jgi:cell division protein FtsB